MISYEEEMEMGVGKKVCIVGLLMMVLFPSMASAQWVFLGRKALGLVSRIADQAHGHESASVLLEADADKVFDASQRIIREKPENEILSKNDAERTLSFRHGGRVITFKVERLQDDLAQILVVSSGGNTPEDADYVVNGILRICKEVGAHCWTSNK
jgi:hypothetical protein